MGRVLRDCKEVAIPFRAGAKRYAALRPRGLQRQRRCTNQGGIFSFLGKRISPLTPLKRKGFDWQSLARMAFMPPECNCPVRGVAAFSIAIRFVSAPTIRCRSAHLVEVQPNHRLSPVPTMRRAQQSRISQAVCRQTNVTRASRSKARLQHVTARRRFMAKPCTPHLHCAARAVIQATDCQCRGSRGSPLAFSWGI